MRKHSAKPKRCRPAHTRTLPHTWTLFDVFTSAHTHVRTPQASAYVDALRVGVGLSVGVPHTLGLRIYVCASVYAGLRNNTLGCSGNFLPILAKLPCGR